MRSASRRPWIVRFLATLPAPLVLSLLYAALISVGAVLLWLPGFRVDPLPFSTAFFTATSAVTVTGLVLVDTGSAFTVAGQAVIALLIQLGGLGLMSFAALVLSAFGIAIGMPSRAILREDLDQTPMGGLFRLVGLIFRIALVVEAVGALILALVFVPDLGWARGLWAAVFHSVSAFNNAGFALWPDSLVRYAADPIINLVIPFMFILGGLGFIVVGDLWSKRSWRRLTLHSKLMIAGSAVLILGGWAAVAALEWRNPQTLGTLDGPWAKAMAAWFQAVTPRTAGFNTVDIAGLHESTALVVMLLMLVGGGSTSTAGGIKVTTMVVLILGTVAFFKRRDRLHVFGRSLGTEDVMKVMALTTLSFLLICTALFLLVLGHDGDFLSLGFEVVSAFGTVGLSRGSTGELDLFGQLVICLVMFVGRVGPLTLGFFLARPGRASVRYPAGQVHLG